MGGEISPAGLSIQQADSIQIKDTALTGAHGVVFKEGILTAENASLFVHGDTIATSVNAVRDDALEFYVERANTVRVECITVSDVTQTTFYDASVLSLETSHGFDLEDCTGQHARAQALSPGAELTLTSI